MCRRLVPRAWARRRSARVGVFGLVSLFVSIPAGNVVYAVLGLVIFGGYTVLDFNRMRRAGMDDAVSIAAGIFLDIVNVFLFFLQLFGRREK
ncbi:MAG: US12 family protein [Solirubrobacterales bacterium]|nr:US12 family protein [Solirubrobacterales bacterium]